MRPGRQGSSTRRLIGGAEQPDPGGPEDDGAAPGLPRSVWAVGAALMACVAWFSWSLPVAPSRLSRASAPLASRIGAWQWLTDHGAPPASSNGLGLTLAGISALFFAAWVGVVLLTWRRPGRAAVRAVMALVAVAVAISIFALPNKTSDVYDYAVFGRVVSVHDGVAYRDVPSEYPNDAVYPYASRQYTAKPDNKLAGWTATAIGVTSIAGNDPVANLLAFRLLLGGATVAASALIAWILLRIRPAAAASGAAFFGLNPITVVYGPEKTDALMVLFLVGGLALVVAGRHHLATVAVTLSVLVKLITAPVLVLVVALPLPSSRLRRRDPTRSTTSAQVWSVATRAVVALATAVVVYGPFRDPLRLAREQLVGGERGGVLPGLGTVSTVVFAVGLAAVAGATWWRRPETAADHTEALLTRSALFLVVFSVFLTRPGLPWYLICALAAAALVSSVVLFVLMAALSGASFLMGWWDAVGTSQHPLPSLQVARPLVYLSVAAVALALAIGATALARRRRLAIGPG